MDNDIGPLFFCSKKDIQYRSDPTDDGRVGLDEIVDIIVDAFNHFPRRGDNFSAAYLGRNRFSKRLKSIGIGRSNSLLQKDNRPIGEFPNTLYVLNNCVYRLRGIRKVLAHINPHVDSRSRSFIENPSRQADIVF